MDASKMAHKHELEDGETVWTLSSLMADVRLVFFVACFGGVVVTTVRSFLG
jgi:hypothetical protein